MIIRCDFTYRGNCAAKIEAACICCDPAYQLMKQFDREEEARLAKMDRLADEQPA